jgi:hypothetical protein
MEVAIIGGFPSCDFKQVAIAAYLMEQIWFRGLMLLSICLALHI